MTTDSIVPEVFAVGFTGLQLMLGGMSRTAVLNAVRRGDLPQPVKLGTARTARVLWIVEDVKKKMSELAQRPALSYPNRNLKLETVAPAKKPARRKAS